MARKDRPKATIETREGKREIVLGEGVLQTLAFDPGEGIVKGFASVAGFQDAYDEVVDLGAFEETLVEHEGRIQFCWQHDWREPIGKLTTIREVPKAQLPTRILEQYPEAIGGLYFEAEIVPTRQGEDAKKLLAAGVIKELSIGFDVKEEYQDDDDIWHLAKLELYEISLVSMAAMPAAQVIEYKGQSPPPLGTTLWLCGIGPEEIRVEETDDTIRVPNPGVGDCEVTATITISDKEGIKALYCGEVKKIRTFLFAKAKGWTVAKAVAWVEEHAEQYKTREMAQGVIELLEQQNWSEALTALHDLIALAESPKPARGQGEAVRLWIRVQEAMIGQSGSLADGDSPGG